MKIINLTLLAIISINAANAQKLPNVQQTGLRAPAGLKIDGKATEWGQFAAYNNATNLWYTMANDDKNLYIAIQADDPIVLTKITHRGIVIAIDASGKRSNKNIATIQYPVLRCSIKNKPFIMFGNASGLTPAQRKANEANPDSMLRTANQKLKTNDKYIRTSGMPGIDTLLSIYNNEDILARQSFEKWAVYSCEIAVPLKYLSLPAGAASKFSYHIILNGMNIDVDMGLKTEKTPGGIVVSFAPGAVFAKKEDIPAIISTTDFWGEYTLAK